MITLNNGDTGATFRSSLNSNFADCLDLNNNLSDLSNASTARTNLWLWTLATQSGTFSGTSSGTNTWDQTSIVWITGTKAQFNTAVTDGDIDYLDSNDTITGIKTFNDGKMWLRNVANTFTGFFSNAITATRTWTLPDSATFIPIISQLLTFTWPTASRTITLPDANFTVARTDAANTFTGVQTMTSPSFTTPVLGTPSSGNLSNCTADGTNEVWFKNIPQNSRSAAYTTVLGDKWFHIFHPSADTTARTFTIDSNANVAYPIGTAITFINQNWAWVVTISITSDTMRLAGAGTTWSRTLAANGIATAIKVTTTEWIISWTGLT